MKIARAIAMVGLMLGPFAAWAEDFDGTKPLICATVDTFSCVPGAACEASTADELNVPQFFRMNFDKKTISATRPDGEVRLSEMQSLELHEGELILQGKQGGLGWSAAITQVSGKLSLSAVGDQVAFVIFGACTPL